MLYQSPPEPLATLLNVPPTPLSSLSPNRKHLLLLDYDAYPPIADLAKPLLKLAGVRFDPTRPGTQRLTRYRNLTRLRVSDGERVPVTGLPEGASPNSPIWSDDGDHVAVMVDLPAGGLGLAVGEIEAATLTMVEGVALADMLTSPVQWIENETLLLTLVPEGATAPVAPLAPDGPIIQEASGKQTRAATYQDLLASPHDEALFRYTATVQLATYSLTTRTITHIGKPVLLTNARPSPDGRYLLVQELLEPFSYRVPYQLFARRTSVWERATGQVVHTVATLPVSDEVPQQGVPTGPRGIVWQPTRPATLLWVEALDGGDPRAHVLHRDAVHTVSAPFTAPAQERFRVTHRFSGWDWPEDTDRALYTEYDRDRRWRTTYQLSLSDPDVTRRPLFDLSVNDAYGDPGQFIYTQKPTGERVIDQRDGAVFLAGRGASPEGDRPFLDRYVLETGERERLFQSDGAHYEAFLAFVDGGLLTSRQSRTEPTNLYVGERPLTHYTDPHPDVTGLHKELVRYTRPDGVPLSGTLYLPPGVDPESSPNLPLLLWAYPEEYSDPSTAGQVRGSDRTFTRLLGTSPLWFLLRGWAVLMDAAMPVIGDPETMNDTFAEQIVGAATAAIDTLVARGIADRGRVIVGGHSYGAFMTANLLAHAPGVFRAGIARSGAYNRTLTPFGFQSERRTYWEAPETYHRLSPFTHADKLKDPILLIHGQSDNNSGTHLLQSERFYQALQAHGATARLVVLPFESHAYRAKESVGHVLWEMLSWAERHAGEVR